MDEDLLKRNTDCVYFLASPLTCKKGAECEYRHNEIARLNPRDCWYWLSGSCLNPTCAFRHPPLDGQTGVPPEPTESSFPVNKTMVPCYFFFNGFCNKGDRCSFLHGPGSDDSFTTVKPVKNDKVGSDAPSRENKTPSENKTGVASKPTETHVDQSLTALKALSNFKLTPKEDLKIPLAKSVKQQGDCQETSAFEYEEATVNRSESPYPDEGFVHNASPLCTEQSQEEHANGHIEPEERWESSPGLSPGFDVLVHDESENLGYEDDSEYVPVLDGEHQELNEQYLGYEFKDLVEYDAMCPDADDLYEQEIYDGYICSDRDHTHANGRKVHGRSRELFFDSMLTRKRIRTADMVACERELDLRDHLRRRRENSGPPGSGFLRRHESSSFMVRNQEGHQRHCIEPRISRRLTSQVGFSTIDSMREVETLSFANKQRLFRNSQQRHRPRKQHYREKPARRQFHSSDVSRKPGFKQRRFIPESTTFSGPKSLAEIKEERKRKAEEGIQDSKPLSEILKGKKCVDRGGNAFDN